LPLADLRSPVVIRCPLSVTRHVWRHEHAAAVQLPPGGRRVTPPAAGTPARLGGSSKWLGRKRAAKTLSTAWCQSERYGHLQGMEVFSHFRGHTGRSSQRHASRVWRIWPLRHLTGAGCGCSSKVSALVWPTSSGIRSLESASPGENSPEPLWSKRPMQIVSRTHFR